MLSSGRKRVHNSTVRCSGFRQLRASNSTIRGDGNHVIGDFNILIGKDNTAEGHGNRFVLPVDPPPSPPPAPPMQPARTPTRRRRAPSPPQNAVSGESFLELILRTMRANEEAMLGALTAPVAQPPPVKQRAAAVTATAVDSDFVSALDLPGEAVPGDSDETRCAVCMENQKDTLFKPCHHICCCRSCARQLTRVHLEQQDNTAFSCPKCRQPVTALAIVYI